MREKNRGVTSSVSLLMLFALFAVLSLMQVLYGARVYERVVARMEDGHALRASLVYVENKLRAHDGKGQATIEDANGVDVLCLWDEDEANVICVYFYDGALMEQYISAETVFLPDAGQEIARLSDFTFSHEGDNGFSLVACTWDGTMRSVSVRLRAPGGGAA